MIERGIDWLSARLLDLAGLFLILMMLHISLDVLLKAVFNYPIQGTLEFTAYYYMVGAVLLPVAAVEVAQASISADLFYNLMPRGMKLVLMALILFLCVLVYAGLCRITWIDAMRAFSRGEFSMGGTSMLIWPSRFFLPISFGLGSVVCLYHLAGLLLSGRTRDKFVQ